jgi:metallo-beta-lactamase family protein
MMNLQFLGAAQTVTGSKYLVSVDKKKILIDCGLFQGLKELRMRNWLPLPVDPKTIDAVVLTHAHIDHSGYLPLLVRNGYKGPIFCTHATKELCGLLLPDSGYLQEEEANYLNKHRRSKHSPALPLYSEEDAENCLKYFQGVDWNTKHSLGNDLGFEFVHASHMLGAASIRFWGQGKNIVFSGDVGRKSDPILHDPQPGLSGETLLMESTYGDRAHSAENPKVALAKIINETFAKKGTLLIPSFAVGRAQTLLFYIYHLKKENLIPDIPVYLNSPMANRASNIYLEYSEDLKISKEEIEAVCNVAVPVTSVEESIALNENKDEPKIIIAASGMATGGRVLHHIKAFAPDARNTILFVGFQAAGTRGEAMVKGAEEIKIHGEMWPIKAKVINLESLSAHADAGELLEWVKGFKKNPQKIFLIHGELSSAEALKARIQSELRIEAEVPKLNESCAL